MKPTREPYNIINSSLLQQDPDLEHVSTRTVISKWLRMELEKEKDVNINIEDLDKNDLLNELIEYADGNTDALWKFDRVDWYKKQLTTEDIQNLYNIAMPNKVGWDYASNGKSIIETARQIIDGEITDSTTRYVDVDYIKSIEHTLPECEMKDIIVFQNVGLSPPRIIDGNHHATAVAMHYLRRDNLVPINAYIGVRNISITNLLYKKLKYTLNY